MYVARFSLIATLISEKACHVGGGCHCCATLEELGIISYFSDSCGTVFYCCFRFVATDVHQLWLDILMLVSLEKATGSRRQAITVG